ncbi:MAG: thiamine diphosphokinase [Christensenellales bacterium]|jgi:thiamine pyrophosphokinase
MRAVIISGGRMADYTFAASLIEEDDYIICADSGYLHARKMNLEPDAVLGDFDSLGHVPESGQVVRLSVRKDDTDTEGALRLAREKGFSRFLFLGCIGSRMDHTLANILLLTGCLRRGEDAWMVDEHNKITAIDAKIILDEPPGAIVSLVPLTTCSGVNTFHMEYPLHDAALIPEESRGISNVTTARGAGYTMKDGLALVIVARD